MSADIPQRNTVFDFLNDEFCCILDYCLLHKEIGMCRHESSHGVICIRWNIKQKIGKETVYGWGRHETMYTAIRLYGYTATRDYTATPLHCYTV